MAGWTPVPNDLLLDQRLSAGAVRLWAQLDDVARDRPTCALSSGALAAMAGCTAREVRRRVTELVDAGWLTTVAGVGRGSSTTFELLRRAPVDRTVRSGFPRSKSDRAVRLPRVALEGITRGEEARGAAAAPAPRRPWCGCCEDEYSRGSYVAGRFVKCPRCHPASIVPAPF